MRRCSRLRKQCARNRAEHCVKIVLLAKSTMQQLTSLPMGGGCGDGKGGEESPATRLVSQSTRADLPVPVLHSWRAEPAHILPQFTHPSVLRGSASSQCKSCSSPPRRRSTSTPPVDSEPTPSLFPHNKHEAASVYNQALVSLVKLMASCAGQSRHEPCFPAVSGRKPLMS